MRIRIGLMPAISAEATIDCSRRPQSALAALGLPCAMERGAPWGPLGLKPSRLMHMIGDDDDGDRDRDATMMAEHDGELMMAMTVALT